MNSPSPQPQPPPDSVWYGWILRLFHHWKVGERQVTYVWAVIVGVVGASMSLFFEWTVEVIQWLLTGIWSEKTASGALMYRVLRSGSMSIAMPHACRDGREPPRMGRLLKQPP